MTMTTCRNCGSDVHITTDDCCDDPDLRVPDELRGPPPEETDQWEGGH